jgi:hypothetical protein
MAGDWIAIRCDLANEPEVISIAEATGLDEYGVVGRLHRLWSWANRHTTDGNAPSVTYSWVDRYLNCDWFAVSMAAVGWLGHDGTALLFPKFERFNSQGAKQRLLTAKRVASHKREGNAKGNAPTVTKALPKEQNRTEQNPPPPAPPPASNGGDRDLGLAWKGVEEDLRKCGVALASKAVRSAASNGVGPDDAINVIAFWRLRPGAWDAGALYHRVSNMHPGEDCSEFWPPESPKSVRAQSREQTTKSHAKVVNERLEGEQRKADELAARNDRESRFGAELDALPRKKIVALIQQKMPQEAEFLLKRMPDRGPTTGFLRDSLLGYLESVPQGHDLLLEAPV